MHPAVQYNSFLPFPCAINTLPFGRRPPSDLFIGTARQLDDGISIFTHPTIVRLHGGPELYKANAEYSHYAG